MYMAQYYLKTKPHNVIRKQAPKRPNIKGKNETGLVPKADRYSQAYDLILSLLSKGEKCFRYFLTIQIQRVCPKTKPGRADTLIVVQVNTIKEVKIGASFPKTSWKEAKKTVDL